jgi:hypothetical protein
MNDTGRPGVPHPPYDELRAALGDDDAQGSVDALQEELSSPKPDADVVRSHAGVLRAFPELEARIANWFDDPNTQRWIKFITDEGL